MRFTVIAAKKAEHTVTILCRCLGEVVTCERKPDDVSLDAYCRMVDAEVAPDDLVLSNGSRQQTLETNTICLVGIWSVLDASTERVRKSRSGAETKWCPSPES